MKKFRDYNPDQLSLLPESIKDWLPEDHPVYYISEVVEQFDLSAIYRKYDSRRGAPPYEPVLMVKILVYAVIKGIHASRRIERALYEDVGFRVLAANQQPDHWTISNFRRRHLKELADLLVETIRIADEVGLVKLNHAAIDGTKIKAHASKNKAMSYGRLIKEEERYQKEIQEYLERAEQEDRADDRQYGDRRGDELPDELSTREKRLKAIQDAKKRIEQRAKDLESEKQERRRKKAEKEGKTYTPRKRPEDAKPKLSDQSNFTDPESRIMQSSDKAFIQAYNAQASVDAQTHIIVAADVSSQANDAPHLESQIEQIMANTGRKPKEVSADAGYYSDDNVNFLLDKTIEAFIPPDKIKHSEWRAKTARLRRIPEGLPVQDKMRLKLRTARGRRRYKLRQTSVEPVFGNIKENIRLRQFLLRSLDKVRSYWRFTCAAHNIGKILKAIMATEKKLATSN